MGKKRKFFASKGSCGSKPGIIDLSSLKKGILMSVTTNGKSFTAYREITGILRNKSGQEEQNVPYCSHEDLTVEESIERESKKLKIEESRFILIEDISRCLVLIQFNNPNDVPSVMVGELMESAYNHKISCINNSVIECPLTSRYVSRLIPLDIICHAKLDQIRKNMKALILSSFSNAFCSDSNLGDVKKVSWACFYNSRCNGSEIKRQDIYDLATELIWGSEDNPKYQEYKNLYPVNLDNPRKSILVEITRSFCGISIVENYYKYYKFNLNKISCCSGQPDSNNE
ncbi:THUMP RNA binding domain-containing protein [Cryptosporidium canis]|uniref:THUMP RNA binding domain-containing protein n=1 Tax=Cryptosporidium canis TaxID=195482 RepID=A0A9D5HWI6_9CRYT|nr:THUMP RNA binding domain-containing protein [Cryptosporidium canis]